MLIFRLHFPDIDNYNMIGGGVETDVIEIPKNECIAFLHISQREHAFLEKIFFVTNKGNVLGFQGVENDCEYFKWMSRNNVPDQVSFENIYLDGIMATATPAGLSNFVPFYQINEFQRSPSNNMYTARELSKFCGFDMDYDALNEEVRVPHNVQDIRAGEQFGAAMEQVDNPVVFPLDPFAQELVEVIDDLLVEPLEDNDGGVFPNMVVLN